eukprot:COSAG01_NODE_5526_length_4205_cov_3.424744_5_plen_99_part_00
MKLMCAKGDAVLDTLRDIDGAGVLMTALRGHAPNFMVQVGALRVSRRGGAEDVGGGAMGGGGGADSRGRGGRVPPAVPRATGAGLPQLPVSQAHSQWG